jgi:hypothetical protein
MKLRFLPLLAAGLSLLFATARADRGPDGLSARLEIPSPEFTIGGPAVTPALSFPATFVLRNRGTAPVVVEASEDAGQPVRVAFRLRNLEGDILWESDALPETPEGPQITLAVGQSWQRTIQIPLFPDDAQLEVGRYVVEAFVAGTPEFRAEASFRMTADFAATESTLRDLAARRRGVFTSLQVADSAVVTRLRNGDNVRLAGSVQATFALENKTMSTIGFAFPDSAASQRKVNFSLLDAEGNVLWRSDQDIVTLPVLVDTLLASGRSWTRTLPIPLYVDGTTLPTGKYTIVGEVAGSPTYRAAATIQVVNQVR